MTEPRYEYKGSRQHHTIVGRTGKSCLEDSVVHRKTVLGLLGGDPDKRKGILCVLGAGHCHDLHLEGLLARFHEVHLVDLSTDAMVAGTREQGFLAHPRIILHGDIDLGGIESLLPNPGIDGQEQEPRPFDARAWLDRIAQHSLSGLEVFDAVLSADVFPSLAMRLAGAVDGQDPGAPALMAALRRRHAEILMNLTKPGGQAILVTELTSSQFLPELTGRPATEQLNKLLQNPEILARLHPGCNPAAWDREIRESQWAGQLVRQYDISAPWLRQQGELVGLYLAYRIIRNG